MSYLMYDTLPQAERGVHLCNEIVRVGANKTRPQNYTEVNPFTYGPHTGTFGVGWDARGERYYNILSAQGRLLTVFANQAELDDFELRRLNQHDLVPEEDWPPQP